MKHCVAGFESQNEKASSSLKVSKARNVDLKSATGRASDFIKFTQVIISDFSK